MIIQPQNHGSFYSICSEGYFINNLSVSNIQKKWKTLLDDMISCYVEAEPDLHSIYLRGTVAKGIAIDHISDMDLVGILNSSKEEKFYKRPNNSFTVSWNELAHRWVYEHYPFCRYVELLLRLKPIVLTNRKAAFTIKTQSVCVYGENLIPQIKPYKLGDPASYIHLPYQKNYTLRTIEELQNTDPHNTDFIEKSLQGLMKATVRSSMEALILKDNSYTRDLYVCYQVFDKHYPEHSHRIYDAMFFTLNPVSEKDKALKIIKDTALWLSEFLETKNLMPKLITEQGN